MPNPAKPTPVTLRRALAASMISALCAVAVGCSTGSGHEATPNEAAPALVAVESGFLPNYKILKPSEQSASVRMYRDDANLKGGFRRILFQPVQVWRGSDRELDTIPEADLHHIADGLYRAMVGRLGDNFELVDKPGDGVLEVSMALTLVLDRKQKVDFVSADVPVPPQVKRSAAMGKATQDFVHDCALEIEFAESMPAAAAKGSTGKSAKPTRVVRAAFFDDGGAGSSAKSGVTSWEELDAVFAKWAAGIDDQLVALRDGTFKPRLTVGTESAPAWQPARRH